MVAGLGRTSPLARAPGTGHGDGLLVQGDQDAVDDGLVRAWCSGVGHGQEPAPSCGAQPFWAAEAGEELEDGGVLGTRTQDPFLPRIIADPLPNQWGWSPVQAKDAGTHVTKRPTERDRW